ncbi:hypothetical protein EEB14_07670 [Rhodococcus sp. WS4]|nr:hypothetical protein EEB14_07670 [Rhodococcus sp. WS4]
MSTPATAEILESVDQGFHTRQGRVGSVDVAGWSLDGSARQEEADRYNISLALPTMGTCHLPR